jgi:hypothetical protein
VLPDTAAPLSRSAGTVALILIIALFGYAGAWRLRARGAATDPD